jgi:GNAT superfamily N-acetyltransferase
MAIVRPYTRADYDQVARLFRQLSRTHRELYRPRKGGRRAPDRWFHRHLRKYGQKSLRVAEDGRRIVGVVGVVSRRGRGEIEPLVVAANRRRHGIARVLVQAVTREARRRRGKALSVGIAARNEVALKTFHSLGFRMLWSLELEMRLRKPPLFVQRAGPIIAGRRFQS